MRRGFKELKQRQKENYTNMSIKGLEQSLKWDKKRAEQIMNDLIYEETATIVQSMVDQAKEGSFQHGSYLLDRAYGKAKQQVDIESGGQPIVFMPTALIAKFGLDKPIEAEKIEEPNVYEVENNEKI